MNSDLFVDIRMALRAWRRRPGLITAVVVTLTAGLGAAIGVFSITYAVLWRPIDVPDPDKVVTIRTVDKGVAGASSPGAALTWQSRARTTAETAIIWRRTATFIDGRGADRLDGLFASPELFTIFGVAAVEGRTFTRDRGESQTLLISEHLWRSRYAQQRIDGESITLNGQPYTVIGVLPSRVSELLGGGDWVAPLRLPPSQVANFGPRYLDVIARLSPDASLTSAQQELEALVPGTMIAITRLSSEQVASHRDLLLLLIGGVLVLFAIACANVASLLLADALDRHREFALRASIGASRTRLVRQLLTEASLIATVAGIGGLIAGQWVVDALRLVLPAGIPRVQTAGVDTASVVFASAAVAVVAFACGALPALRATNLDLVGGLSGLGLRAVSGDDRLRRAFVVAQVALSVVLATAAGLVLRSAHALQAAPRGFEAQGLSTTTIGLPSQYTAPAAIATLVDRLGTELRGIPGIADAAIASRLPLGGDTVGSDVVLAGEQTLSDGGIQARIRLVSGDYAAATGMRIVAGRDLAAEDGTAAPYAVVVNATLARMLLPRGEIVGRAIAFAVAPFNDGQQMRPWTVVGVADDWLDRGPRQRVQPEVFVAMAQAPREVFTWMNRQLVVAVRSDLPVLEQTAALRQAIARVDSQIPIGPISSVDEQLHAAFARERVASVLLSAAGIAGLLLAAFGLFGVINQLVRRKTLEISVRLALGGQPRDVIGDFVRDGCVLAAIGLVLGLTASLGASGALSSMLYGVGRFDLLTTTVVVAGVFAGATLATWWPARRGVRVDLSAVLRGR